MATKFLDKTGLSYFWSKIKAWCNSLFALDSTVVHKTGNEAISNWKSFEVMSVSNPVLVKGTKPSSTQYMTIYVEDKNDHGSWAESCLGCFETTVSNTNIVSTRMKALKNEANSTAEAFVACAYDTDNGYPYAIASPTRTERTNGWDIVTRDWIPKDTRIVHTTGNEDISGIKTFFNDIVINQSTLKAIVKDTNSDTTRTDTIIKANSSNTDYGINTLFGSANNCIIGAGEGKDSQLDELAGQMSENVYIVADGGIYLKPNANTFANAKDIWFNPSGGITFTAHNITRGTAPSSTYEVLPVEVRDSASNRIGILSVLYNTDKSSLSALYAYNTTTASGANIGRLGIGCDSSGHVYTIAPTPSASDNSTKIATTEFVNTFVANATGVVHTTGNERVDGRKTFTSNIFINNDTPSLYNKFTNVTRGTFLSENKFFPLVATLDKDEKYLFQIQAGLYSSGGSTLALLTYKQDSTTDYSYFSLNNDNGAHGLNTNISFHNMATNSFQQTMNSGNTYYNLFAGKNAYDGACFTLLGRTHPYNPGWFVLHASNKSSSSSEGNRTTLAGLPNGTLQWNGQSIQTSSDRRLKTPISEVNDDVLDAWENVFWGEFKFLSSVKEKGDDARSHIGLIAQDVDEICTASNIDICHYGILCHDTHLNGPDEPSADLWMIRYTEALCMEAAYQRRKNKVLENRISELEKRLAQLEGAI